MSFDFKFKMKEVTTVLGLLLLGYAIIRIRPFIDVFVDKIPFPEPLVTLIIILLAIWAIKIK